MEQIEGISIVRKKKHNQQRTNSSTGIWLHGKRLTKRKESKEKKIIKHQRECELVHL